MRVDQADPSAIPGLEMRLFARRGEEPTDPQLTGLRFDQVRMAMNINCVIV